MGAYLNTNTISLSNSLPTYSEVTAIGIISSMRMDNEQGEPVIRANGYYLEGVDKVEFDWIVGGEFNEIIEFCLKQGRTLGDQFDNKPLRMVIRKFSSKHGVLQRVCFLGPKEIRTYGLTELEADKIYAA